MVEFRKEFLKEEVEREHGSAITKTHEGRRHHTRTIAACAKGASWQTETSADQLAGEPGPGDPRDRQPTPSERTDEAQTTPTIQSRSRAPSATTASRTSPQSLDPISRHNHPSRST